MIPEEGCSITHGDIRSYGLAMMISRVATRKYLILVGVKIWPRFHSLDLFADTFYTNIVKTPLDFIYCVLLTDDQICHDPG